MTSLGFHGAARTVTGSRYLLEHENVRTVIDAGLFQGFKSLRELNWREPPFAPARARRVLLTHAHIDHSGALPLLVRQGFDGPIYATRSTVELARLMLMDSAEIQEEHARYANRKGFSKHKPALPLYTEADAKRTLKHLEKVDFEEWLDLGHGLRARWHGAGHILGAASIEIEIDRKGGSGTSTLVFSGDIGRYDMPLHRDPSPRPACAVLVCESTYGNRDHDVSVPIDEQLARALRPTLEHGGTVLIPSFAVGRAQQITLILRRLILAGRLPDVPLHIDSPMAVDATRIYGHYLDEHHLDSDVFEDGRSVLFPEHVQLHRRVEDSKALNDLPGPRVILSASGMLTAGRVLHHLRRLAGDRNSLVVLAGYQAPGTRGRALLEGQPSVRIFGQDVAIRCRCIAISGLSAHGDRRELLRWVRSCEEMPKKVFLTHGEPESAFAFASLLESELGLTDVEVPALDDVVELGPLLA